MGYICRLKSGEMNSEKGNKNIGIGQEQIDACIDVLSHLVENTNDLFELPESKRIALMTVAGLLSRPGKEEFTRRKKDAKKATKRKQIERDKHARKETGIRSAREAAVFEAPKLIASSQLQERDLQLKSA